MQRNCTHFCPRSGVPETFLPPTVCTETLVESHLGDIPVVSGEWGYSAAWYGTDSAAIQTQVLFLKFHDAHMKRVCTVFVN